MVERLGEMRKGRKERIEKERKEIKGVEMTFEEEEEEHHLPLLVVQLPQRLRYFPTRFCSKALQQ